MTCNAKAFDCNTALNGENTRRCGMCKNRYCKKCYNSMGRVFCLVNEEKICYGCRNILQMLQWAEDNDREIQYGPGMIHLKSKKQ